MGEKKLTREEVAKFLEKDSQFAEEYFSTKATSSMVEKWITKHSGGKESISWSGATGTSLGDTEKGAAILKHFRKSMSGAGGSLKNLISGSPKPKTLRRSRTVLKEMNEKEMFMELIRDIANELDINTLSHKILMNVSILTNGDRSSLFLVRGPKEKRYLVSKLFDVSENSTLEESIHSEADEIRIPIGKGIVGHVALTKETVNIKNAYEDPRFNREIDKKTGYKTHSILCMPICSHEGEVIGVAQIINKISGDHEFTAKDEQVFANYLTFCGIGLMNAQLFDMSVQEYKRNQMLLQLARGIFEEQSSLDGVVHKMMSEAISLLKCERVLVFILEEHEEGMSIFERMGKKFNKDEVVFATAFDLFAKDGEVKKPSAATMEWSSKNGIAKHVATTGETLNIEDTQNNSPFKMGVDEGSGFTPRTLLCMPIYNSEHKIIGVTQLLNKVSGQPFHEQDVNIFEAFAIFCGLGIHNTQMYENACKLMAKQAVALEVLSYHATAQPEEVDKIKKMEIRSAEDFGLFDFRFDDLKLAEDETLTASIRMFQECDLINKFHVPYDVMCTWLLSVKKNYRNVTYHNWRHAFNVAQTMFAMVKSGGMDIVITDLECFALIVACLCHDLDHRGTNNAYQLKSESPLAQLYGTSTMEHHHFDHCIMILNSEGNNIFESLSSEDYRNVIKILESAILSTDLALYFKKRGSFSQLVEKGEKDWKDTEKKDLLRGMMMTACDVSAITKPWEIQHRVAELVAGEFFEQGDLEKVQLGQQPIAMMDREKKDELPKMQVGFIDAICMPVYKMFADIWPGLTPLYSGVKSNRDNWQALADVHEDAQGNKNRGEDADERVNSTSAGTAKTDSNAQASNSNNPSSHPSPTPQPTTLPPQPPSADSKEMREKASSDTAAPEKDGDLKHSEVITPPKKLETSQDNIDVEKQNMKNVEGSRSATRRTSAVHNQERESLDSKPKSSLCVLL
ncbi:cGMP-specific 3',5'-cyclic phosphodiesterase-like isoform X6 [Ptychodera flava]|uniref:cGMP-specific 3',5'-cyclic phosphodiesterase-like isoform X6 n=1 Tax=Ptychodera flava TaxID=63121 RepID=UPI003969FDF2